MKELFILLLFHGTIACDCFFKKVYNNFTEMKSYEISDSLINSLTIQRSNKDTIQDSCFYKYYSNYKAKLFSVGSIKINPKLNSIIIIESYDQSVLNKAIKLLNFDNDGVILSSLTIGQIIADYNGQGAIYYKIFPKIKGDTIVLKNYKEVVDFSSNTEEKKLLKTESYLIKSSGILKLIESN